MEDEEFERQMLDKIKTLASECSERGIPFLAVLDFKGGLSYLLCQKKVMSFGFQLTTWAAKANGNIDKLFLDIKRYTKKYGHSSMVLKLLEKGEGE